MTDNSTIPANDALTDGPLDLCTICGEHPRWGALSRCVRCIQASAEVDRQTRAAAEARVMARGHGPKIAEAVRALQAAGKLPPNLRPIELEKRIHICLRAAGYADAELPSRRAIGRHLSAICKAPNTPHSHSDG